MSAHKDIPVVQRARKARLAVIEASAGTGKTYTLEHLVVSLVIDEGIDLSQIVVVTFTEKATQELKTRVRSGLLHARQSLAGGSDAFIRVSRALDGFDEAPIFTMHAFCRRVLADHAFDSGRRFAEALVQGAQTWRQAFDAVLREELPKQGEQAELFALVLSQENNFDELASDLAGLRNIDARVAPTWSSTRMLELVRAVHQSSAAMLDAIEQSALQSRSKKTLRDRIETIASHVRAEVCSSAVEALRAVLALTDALAKPPATYAKLVEEGDPRVLAFERAWNALLAGTPSARGIAVQLLYEKVHARMERDKRARGELDFHDLLTEIASALRGPRSGALLASLRARYRVALIDEFQDTDALQWEIFNKIFFQSASHRLIVVGDPKQAIYGFRGADVQTYRDARQQMIDAGGERLDLDVNYRSSDAMVRAYNALLNDASGALFSGANEYPHPVRAATSQAAFVESDGSIGAACVVLQIGEVDDVGSAKARASSAIAQEIARLIDPAQGCAWIDGAGTKHAVRAEDIFVLSYTTAEARQIARALGHAGVPFAFFKQEGLFQSDESADLEALLEAVASPSSSTRARALLTPLFGVPIDGVTAVLEDGAAHASTATLNALTSFASRRQWSAFFRVLLDESGACVRALLLCDERAFTNYQHLCELLEAHARQSFCTASELLFALRGFRSGSRDLPGEDANIQRIERDAAAIQIMTVHKSKGLEAPIVFLYGGLSRNTFEATVVRGKDGQRTQWLGADTPSDVQASAQREKREEQERLAYVAMTRPRVRLYLPSYPLKAGNRALVTGSYACISDRLHAIREQPDSLLFSWRQARGSTTTRRSTFVVNEAALEDLPLSPDVSAHVAQLRQLRRAPVFSSYSRIARRLKKNERELASDDRAFELTEESAVQQTRSALAPGVATGLFLHAVLEKCDVQTVRAARSPHDLVADASFLALLQSEGRNHGISAEGMELAVPLVYRAMRSRWQLDARVIDGLISATHLLRETEFLYPIPESHHPRLHQATMNTGFSAERGYVRGFIDALFEYEGRGYVLDWKSDALRSFDQASLREHVTAHYGVQAKLYGFALARMLGVVDQSSYDARFGGLLYVFLRGEENQATSLVFTRPTWQELCDWEQSLISFTEWS